MNCTPIESDRVFEFGTIVFAPHSDAKISWWCNVDRQTLDQLAAANRERMRNNAREFHQVSNYTLALHAPPYPGKAKHGLPAGKLTSGMATMAVMAGDL